MADVTPTPAQQAFLREVAERVIREFVEGVKEGITPDWLKMSERNRGVILGDGSAAELNRLVQTATVKVSWEEPTDGLFDEDPQDDDEVCGDCYGPEDDEDYFDSLEAYRDVA